MIRRLLNLLILVLVSVIIFQCSSVTGEANKHDTMFKGFMIDAPRGVETMDYYFRLIDFLSNEGINTIIFRLTDDEGSAYKFRSHPELKMSDGALNYKELKQLIDYAEEKGIEMIPEIESFGHARYITDTDRYKFLDDAPEGSYFSAICPVSDSSLMLFKDLYTEVAPIFPGKYFHIGCDEVNWGHSERSKNALKYKSRSQIWTDYVNKLNEYVKDLGKETMIWGDYPIRKDTGALDQLSKDIIIVDWNYTETNKDKIIKTADNVLNKGFRLVASPAVNWCEWELRVGARQLDNISAYADVFFNDLHNPGNMGVILTNWKPQRYLQNSQWDTYYIAAHLISDDKTHNYLELIPAFLKQHFGVDYNKDWEFIYKTLYEDIPQTIECRSVDSLMFIPWHSDKNVREIFEKKKPMVNHFHKAAELLTTYRDSVKRNRTDLKALLLTVEFIDYNFNRHNELIDFMSSRQFSPTSVKHFFGEIAKNDQVMLSKVDSAWRVGRRSDNPGKISEEYLWSFRKAAAYSEYLSNNPESFMCLYYTLNRILINNRKE
ncbi:MAG: family 20 glycosylhydrolase [Chlorobi bacterium]|nr:family 20 glycosylhydrolase [Chlorobiota bacterium]